MKITKCTLYLELVQIDSTEIMIVVSLKMQHNKQHNTKYPSLHNNTGHKLIQSKYIM